MFSFDVRSKITTLYRIIYETRSTSLVMFVSGDMTKQGAKFAVTSQKLTNFIKQNIKHQKQFNNLY